MIGTVQDITERKAAEELIAIRGRQQEAVAKIGFEATRATTLESLFDFATRAVAQALGVELCKVLQLVPDGGHLRLVSGVGWQAGLIGVGTVEVDLGSQAGFTLKSDGPIYVNDFATETRFSAPPLLQQHDVVSGLSVKILLRDKPWGVLGAHCRKVRNFDDGDADFMQTVATLLAVVIERLAVQRTLTESEARMRDAQRIAHLGNWELDIAKNELTWSEEVFRIFGVEPAGFSATNEAFFALVHPDDREAMQAAQSIALAGQGPLEIEHRIIRGDGSIRHVRERGELIHDENGRPVALSGTVLDTTDLRAAQSQAERMNALLSEAQRIADMGSWEMDLTSGTLVWSEETCRLFGIQPEEFGGTFENFTGFILPEDMAAYSAVHAGITPEAPLLEAEYRIRRPDGEVRWMFERGMVTFDAAGNATRRLGVVMDVTERKLAEAERSRMFNLSLDLLSIGNFEGELDQVNPAWTECLGWSAEEIINRPWLDFVHPDDHAATIRTAAEICSGRAIRDFENRYLCKDGSYRWLSWNSHPLPETRQIFGVARDVTERRKNEEQLRLLETCVSRLNDIVLITDAEPIDDPGPRILYVNDAFVRRTGFTREEAIGKTPRLLQGPKTQRDALDRIRAALKAWKPVREELINYTKSGEEFWLELDIVPVADATGWFTHWVSIERDITERKLAEEQLRQREQLLRIAGDVARMGGWSVDFPEVRITWSDEVCAIQDMPPGTVPALDQALDFYTSESRPVIESAFSLCASEGTPFDLELEVLTAKGRRIWVRSIGQAERDKAGVITRVQGAFQDITEQKAAEDQIRELGGRLVSTLESITDAFFTVDREWRFTYLNAEAEKLLERDRASLLGRKIWDEFPEVLGSIFQREYERAFAAMHAVTFEEYFAPLSKWFEVRAFPSTDGLAVYFHDVTELRHSREALAASEKEFRNLAEAMPQIVWITRPDGWNTYFNQHWMDYTGLTLEESLGHGWNKPFHPEDQQRAWNAWELATTTVGTYTLECRLRRADGEYRWWLIRGEPQKDAQGNVLKWFGTCTDIHDLKVAELEITRTNRALKLLSGCNEALIHAEDEITLLRDLCELAVQIGGYRMAWVGYAQDDEKRSITPMAHAGVEDGYLAEVSITWDEQGRFGQGPAGRVIRSGEPFVCKDVESDEFFMWIEQARQRGYRSVICLPLRDKQRTFGVLGLYSAEVNVTNAEELKLLQEMADDLAFGILTLRTRIDQRRTHEAVLTMARGISASTGDEFFEKLTFSMVEALGAHAGFIARLNDDKSMSSTLCAVVDGKRAPDFEYALSGTPCEHLDRKDVWIVPKDVRQQYPQANLLTDLSVNAYIGTELYDADGKTCGQMCVLFQQPLEQHEFIVSTLKIFASRAAGELERQKTDVRLREQAALLDKAQDAILVRDLDHKILFWNRSAERLYGWTAAEAVGRNARELLYMETGLVDAAIQQLVKQGEWVGELQQTTKEGKLLTIEAHWSLVRDELGSPKSILSINTDVTERKKIEAQYLRAQRMESIGTLAGGIAHDLNNVLAPIMMSIELLKMQEKNPMRLSILTTIEGSAKRGADMVRQVLSFARGVEGQQLEVQVGHLVKEIEKIVQDTFLKNIQVRSNIPTDLWLVQGDPTQLHQVLLNLCVNARDAMPNGGTLTLAASNLMLDEQYAGMNVEAKPGPHVRILVEDTGTGMPPEVVERIFEPFFTTKEIGKGTGLGLSTSIAIIKSHGGFVRVYSEVGMGTRFHVYLPAHTEASAPQGFAASLELPRGNGEMVLVVDDEAAVREITRQTLETFGYRVLLASDGVEATSIYATRKQEIALVLTDMMMPLMDGPTTIQVLLRLNPDVRIIAASGLNANGMVAKATNAGVKHFIPKPYTAETLLKTLREVLESYGVKTP